MKRAKLLRLAILASLCLVGSFSPARAAITAVGNVVLPVFIGYSSAGTLTVDNGSDLLSYYSYIGYNIASTGVVTADGTGSTCTNDEVCRDRLDV